ncbi:MAG: fumarylacetoacetate hydrolase family protein [Rhodospirillales bacterium]|nr:fumarylacetoacetate hydrolase family protein [Rhodospirillales bacterium]
MKLMRYRHDGQDALGVMRDDGVIDVTGATGAVANFAAALTPEGLDAIRAGADGAAATHKIDAVEAMLPLSPGARVFCVGQNYVGHIEEMDYEIPDFPAIFIRTHASFAPHGADIIKPNASDQYDYEAELTAVIGRPARHVAEADALDYVAGYTIMNEGSVRDWQRRGPQVTPGKNFDRSGAIGPCIATTDDIPDPAALTMETRINGETRQSTRTDDMVFSIPYLISYISTFCGLLPGDMISTGSPSGSAAGFTPPKWLVPGDLVEMEITPIGVLRNRVAAE